MSDLDDPLLEGYYERFPDARDAIPRLEVVGIELARAQWSNLSCDGQSSMLVRVRLATEGLYGLHDLGFYFLVIRGSDDFGVVESWPVVPYEASIDEIEPNTREGTFGFSWSEEPIEVNDVIDLDVAVFAVAPDGLLGYPTVFSVHHDPSQSAH